MLSSFIIKVIPETHNTQQQYSFFLLKKKDDSVDWWVKLCGEFLKTFKRFDFLRDIKILHL